MRNVAINQIRSIASLDGRLSHVATPLVVVRGDALWILLLLAGSTLLSVASESLDPFFVAILFLLIGVAVSRAAFQRSRLETRAFLLCYGACVMVAGLAQSYSLLTFGVPQNFVDALHFLDNISPSPPFTQFGDMAPNYKPRLAIMIWQQVYRLTWLLGLKFGPYIGVLFNALVVGLSGSMTVRIARELFGNDCWRLRRVGTLCACSGMFWLFGGLLLRDCFCLFFSTLALWALVHWLSRSTPSSLVLAVFAVGTSAVAIWYLRWMISLLYGFFGLLALLCWLGRRGLDAKGMALVLVVGAAILVGSTYISSYLASSASYRAEFAEGYEEIGYRSTSGGDDSLGIQLVVEQPLPVRLFLGAGTLALRPIPLWALIAPGVRDYHLILSANGIYQVLVMPLLLAGLLMVFATVLSTRTLSPLFFLAAYSLFNTAVVASTSLELRHLAQFYPAFIVLAVVPDTRERESRHLVKSMACVWFSMVTLVHILWFVMKYRQ